MIWEIKCKWNLLVQVAEETLSGSRRSSADDATFLWDSLPILLTDEYFY
jgi:hypothetical protein